MPVAWNRAGSSDYNGLVTLPLAPWTQCRSGAMRLLQDAATKKMFENSGGPLIRLSCCEKRGCWMRSLNSLRQNYCNVTPFDRHPFSLLRTASALCRDLRARAE